MTSMNGTRRTSLKCKREPSHETPGFDRVSLESAPMDNETERAFMRIRINETTPPAPAD